MAKEKLVQVLRGKKVRNCQRMGCVLTHVLIDLLHKHMGPTGGEAGRRGQGRLGERRGHGQRGGRRRWGLQQQQRRRRRGGSRSREEAGAEVTGSMYGRTDGKAKVTGPTNEINKTKEINM